MSQRRHAQLLLAACGVLLISYLLWRHDFSGVIAGIEIVGGWIFALVFLRLGIIAVMAFAWRRLLAPAGNAGLFWFTCFRWVAESINTLLPVAQVGGDLVRARLAGRSVPAGTPFAAASVAVDMTINLLAQGLLAGVGVWHVWSRVSDRALLLSACGVAVLPLAAIVYAQRTGFLRGSMGLHDRLQPRFGRSLIVAAQPFARGLGAIYANTARLTLAMLCHVIAGLGRAWEVWLILAVLQHGVGFLDAIMIEALSTAVRTAAFIVPAGLGIQEGALMLVCAWVGVPAASALALALIKRVRELLVGAPGLAVWALMEGRRSVTAE